MRSILVYASVGAIVLGGVVASQHAAANAYPTEVVADYVIGCMASNGATPGHAAPLLLQHRHGRLDPAVRHL